MRALLTLALLAPAACSEPPAERSVAENAAMYEQALETQADNMEALADAAANADAAAAIEQAADNLEAMADQVEDVAQNR